jgi:hypothetical protein
VKTLVYLLAAVILGILVTVVPLFTIAQIGSGNRDGNVLYPSSIGRDLSHLEGGYGSNASTSNISDLTVLPISLVIALVAYFWIKHRTSS